MVVRSAEGGPGNSALRAIDPSTGLTALGAPLPQLPVEYHARSIRRAISTATGINSR